MHTGGDNSNEGQFLVDVDRLTDEVLTHPPHLIATKVLVLESEFNIVCTPLVFVDLTPDFNALTLI